MSQIKVVQKTKIHVVRSTTFLFENCAVYEVCGKILYSRADDNMAHTHYILLIKSTNTHSEYVIFIAFNCNNGCTNVPRCYVLVYCLPVLILPYKMFQNIF